MRSFEKYFDDLDDYFKENPDILMEAFLEADKMGSNPIDDKFKFSELQIEELRNMEFNFSDICEFSGSFLHDVTKHDFETIENI